MPHNSAGCTEQPKDTASPVASNITSERWPQEKLSPDDFDCFNLRCYVQPIPVITIAMFQKLAADASDNNNSSGVLTIADAFAKSQSSIAGF